MAANPPISNFHTNGSLDVQTRINRFLSTIEPHTRFFTAQGRTYLDSLIERDKKEDRALKADKTGWATVGLDPTSTLIDVAQAGEDATESGKSATGMSSVSQRGGLRARMRDRYGNTSAMITAVRSVKLAKTKVNSKEMPVNVLNTSSSSPIKAWRDIRPKSSVQATSTSKVLLEPVVEIPVYSTNIGHVERDDIQHSPTETLEKATSKKRKMLDGDSISMADVDVKTSRKQGDSWSDAKPAPAAKKSKAHATDEAENHRRPLGESSARLNSAKNRGSRKETKVDLSQINLRSKALIKTATRQQLSEKAEDQAREESVHGSR
ncbi:hypothetical protein NliqN6_3550 [Naganishia liquefaciens]|uniref:Uncharacterized protein n=1 Tax=Naganishia liquefaciens TaxID=104408 RepID=A0A8H3TU45_9TREE|nr:hypothetical protein NliqN6_3550 [Naganishia liquefaciens]